MLRLFPISILFLALILIRLGYVYGVFSQRSQIPPQNAGTARSTPIASSSSAQTHRLGSVSTTEPAAPPDRGDSRRNVASAN